VRVLICGAGALGSGIGGMLRTGGHDVDLLGFGEHVRAVSSGGLDMEGLWGERHLDGMTATEDPKSLLQPEWIVLSTKSCDTEAALEGIQHLLPGCRGVFCPQNGLGNEERIAEKVGWEKTLGGMVIIGFEVVRPGRVRVTVEADSVKVGRMKGSVDSLVKEFVHLLKESGVPVEAVDSVERYKWAKLLYNAALNPLGALLRVPYGCLLSEPSWAVIEEVVRETYSVLGSLGMSTLWPDAQTYLDHLKSNQIPATAEHRASMLQDIEAGRKTEIDALNGVIVAKGEAAGICTPVNQTLVRLIQALESAD